MRKILVASIFVLTFCAFAFGQDLSCPQIFVTGPLSIPQPNEPMTFTITVDEKAKDLKLEYLWSVDKGKIIEGQGTRIITVEWKQDYGVTATVKVKGLPENCSNTASEMVMGHLPPQPEIIGELSTSDSEIDSAKFDKIITALKDDSNVTVYIIIYTDEKTPPQKLEQRETQLRKYLKDKNVPPKRIVIVNGGAGEDLIRLWLVPVGAEPPTP